GAQDHAAVAHDAARGGGHPEAPTPREPATGRDARVHRRDRRRRDLFAAIDVGATASIVTVPLLVVGLGLGALASNEGDTCRVRPHEGEWFPPSRVLVARWAERMVTESMLRGGGCEDRR